jgi:predicted transposase/invertase (TIGR01784 family)
MSSYEEVMHMKRLKVKNDFVFHKLFGEIKNKDILISFLNAVLELENSKKLDDIEIIDGTELKRDSLADKLGILDIRAKTVQGEQINIEVQLVNQNNMDKRTLFYWSKMFTEQLKEGQPYNDLKKTIAINILDFNFIEVEKFSTVFHLWEDKNKFCKLTDVLEIRFLELPKFRKKQPDLSNPLERWMVFIEGSPQEVLEMAKEAEPAIAKAEEILAQLGSFDEVRRYYEAREKAIHDEISRITGAKAEGREEGIALGIAQGIEQGIVRGQRETSMQIAKSLLGILDVQTISDKTGLSLKEVEELKRQ